MYDSLASDASMAEAALRRLEEHENEGYEWDHEVEHGSDPGPEPHLEVHQETQRHSHRYSQLQPETQETLAVYEEVELRRPSSDSFESEKTLPAALPARPKSTLSPEIIHSKSPMSSRAPSPVRDPNANEKAISSDELLKEEPNTKYLTGTRLHILTAALLLGIFLPNFEISVVSTSLVAITDDLQGFDKSSWIVTVYLIAYTGMLIVLAKLSDIFGRKSMLISSLALFTLASAACGAAQSMTQLIVFRAFQGIGGGGCYSLTILIMYELTPPPKIPIYTSLVSACFAVSLLMGPLVGGLINIHTTWRWVFLLNCPAGVIALILLAVFMPNFFPYHHVPAGKRPNREVSLKSLGRIDVPGVVFLCAGTAAIIIGLQEAGDGSAWVTPQVLVPILLSLPFWVSFVVWEWYISTHESSMEPVFPWRLFCNRIWMMMIVNCFLVGSVFTVCVIQIPLRYQIVNGCSTLEAGERLLPFTVVTPLAVIVAAVLAGRLQVPPMFITLAGALLQVAGVAVLSVLNTTPAPPVIEYGFEAVAALGIGMNIGSLTMMLPYAIERRDDLAVATGALNQFRLMGGAIGLACVTAVLYSWLRADLLSVVDGPTLHKLLESTAAIGELAPATAAAVQNAFGQGFDLQFKITLGCAVAQVPAALALWQRKLIRIKSRTRG